MLPAGKILCEGAMAPVFCMCTFVCDDYSYSRKIIHPHGLTQARSNTLMPIITPRRCWSKPWLLWIWTPKPSWLVRLFKYYGGRRYTAELSGSSNSPCWSMDNASQPPHQPLPCRRTEWHPALDCCDHVTLCGGQAESDAGLQTIARRSQS